MSKVYVNGDGSPYVYSEDEVITLARKCMRPGALNDGTNLFWHVKGLLEIIDRRQLDEIRKLGT